MTNEHIHIYIPDDCLDVAAARQRVRDILGGSTLPREITVHIPAGEYSSKDFQFTGEDSSRDVHITYAAEKGAVINGGITIPASEWKMPDPEMKERFYDYARENIRMIDLTEYGLTADDWGIIKPIGTYESSRHYDNVPDGNTNEFFCGDRRMTLARYPDTEYAKLDGVVDPGAIVATEKDRNPAAGAYVIGADVNERVKSWKEPTNDVWIFGYLASDWADTSSPIIELDTETRVIKPRYYSRWGVRSDAHYFFYNVPEELDCPGEWYLDRKSGKLYFYPYEGAESADFTYSAMPLIGCEGTVNMTFSGFSMRCTMNDAVVSEGDDMTFTRLYVSNVYGNAVRSTGYRCVVSDSEFTHTGRGGVVINGGDRTTLTPGCNRVTNNYIHDFAEVFVTYNPAVLLNDAGNVCDHNEICNTPHMAIKYTGNDHLIEYNDIHDVVLHSSDAGAIYAGQDWTAYGTVIRYNKIENVGSGEFVPDGIYWDDILSGQSAYRNLLIGVRKHSFMIGGGRENKVEDNVIIDTYVTEEGHLVGHPITYDDRAREGFLREGWMRRAVITEGRGYWCGFEKWPIREGIWAERYPNLAKTKTVFAETDPDDKDFPINTSYVSVCRNVITVREDPFYIWDSVYRYGTIENNPVYNSIDEAGWDTEKRCFKADSPVFRDLPGFENIPVDEIGRKPIEE
ncbi:MAG: right-handed parallel beta-helix repeat-containing protein [Clostridia bacterium]|nr:right-handed parallel beta-helix repeat-containing protein [Clostridia bacterium]